MTPGLGKELRAPHRIHELCSADHALKDGPVRYGAAIWLQLSAAGVKDEQDAPCSEAVQSRQRTQQVPRFAPLFDLQTRSLLETDSWNTLCSAAGIMGPTHIVHRESHEQCHAQNLHFLQKDLSNQKMCGHLMKDRSQWLCRILLVDRSQHVKHSCIALFLLRCMYYQTCQSPGFPACRNIQCLN